MAHQSLHLSRPDEALRLAGFGLAVENNSSAAVSDATRSYLSSVQSWTYAVLGETTACERALGRAEQYFAVVSSNADVQPDNLFQDRDGRWLLINWDRASHGPRELDLAFAVPDYFHEPDSDRAEFSAAYGYDITAWAGWTLILRDLTELHSLAGYIRRAATNPITPPTHRFPRRQ